jgi:hypothetical protein
MDSVMLRTSAALLGAIALLAPAASAAPPAGTWKLTFPIGQGQKLTFLFELKEADGKWAGKFIDSSHELQGEPSIDDVKVVGDNLGFAIKIGPGLSFDGRIPKEGAIRGSLAVGGGQVELVKLEPSQLKSLKDKFETAKEALASGESGPEMFNATFEMLKMAGEKKAKPDEVRGWAEQATKAAEAYGPRWQRTVALTMAQALAPQEAFAPVAIEQARRAERMLDPKDDASAQMQVLETLAQVLDKAKKPDDAKEVRGRLAKLEARDYAEYTKKNPPFKPETYEGRKAKSDRAVLVELFTGAECPPCVAADLAFDAIGRTYKPGEVILLQYHMHIPGPDPLTIKDSAAKQQFYKFRGTPSIFFNGMAEAGGGGPASAAKGKYRQYRDVIDELLEKPASVKLTATATRKGGDIAITAKASDLAKPGEKVFLRLALVEDHVKYSGSNGLRYHHNVVRALPGGPVGVVLTKKDGEQSVKVSLDELRGAQMKYLKEFSKENEAEFPEDVPLALKDLKLVAFVQDDSTGEVLQAVQVPIEES